MESFCLACEQDRLGRGWGWAVEIVPLNLSAVVLLSEREPLEGNLALGTEMSWDHVLSQLLLGLTHGEAQM